MDSLIPPGGGNRRTRPPKLPSVRSVSQGAIAAAATLVRTAVDAMTGLSHSTPPPSPPSMPPAPRSPVRSRTPSTATGLSPGAQSASRPAEGPVFAQVEDLLGASAMRRINAHAERMAAASSQGATTDAAARQSVVTDARHSLLVGMLGELGYISATDLVPPETRALHAVRTALSDVAAWYQTLHPVHLQKLHVRREDDYCCAISQKPFASLTHPVAIATGGVVHVFEAEALLQWMHTSMTMPANKGVATHPIDRSPLTLGQLWPATNVAYGPVGPPRS